MRLFTVLKCAFVALVAALCVVPSFADSYLVADGADVPHAEYIGGGYISGHSAELGDCVIFVPISSKGMWGLSSDSYLVNVGNSSYTGTLITSDGTEYYFSASAYSLPRYRSSSSSYTYSDLHFKVSESNLQVATSFPSSFTMADSWYYVAIGIMGVILCCLILSKR